MISKKIGDSNDSNESPIAPHQVLGHDFFGGKINESNHSNECTSQKESTAKQFEDALPNYMEPESGHGPERKINHVPEVKPKRRADVFVKWNCVEHLQLWYTDDEVLHFPWANNSCALDSTLSALWVIYLRFQTNLDRLQLFREEFPTMVGVFDDLYLGLIHNIEAKEKLIKVFALEDKRYKNRDFIEVLSITDFLKERLSVAVARGTDSLFQWIFKLYWKCETCGNKVFSEHLHRRDNILFMATSAKFNVQDSLKAFLRESVRVRICTICEVQTLIVRETIKHPIILHLSYPSQDWEGNLDLPHFLEKELVIEKLCMI